MTGDSIAGASQTPSATEPASPKEAAPSKQPTAEKPSKSVPPASEKGSQTETYRNLIQKAQNLTLQRDRLQASQVLIRAMSRETRGGPAYKELARTLDELSSMFYTEKAQTVFVVGESLMDTKPKEALDSLQEALRLEEGNVTVLKALARAHLMMGECARADGYVRNAEAMNPPSAEVKLLRLQTMECLGQVDLLAQKLAAPDLSLEPVDKFARGLMISDFLRRKEYKKAKTVLTSWQAQMPEYPQVHYWKWRLGEATGVADRAAAIQYSQLCQSLSPRRRKSYILDVDLCKGKEAVDRYLKENGFQPSAPGEEPVRD